uniref:Transmembrane protein 9 n=1 Tax=Plectus sambesii TaxID=2011161 RepID=A0A914VEM8_9BILA
MSFVVILISILAVLSLNVGCVRGQFEDARCRCVCPSIQPYANPNATGLNLKQRYYTESNIHSDECGTNVVRKSVLKDVDVTRLETFLANCECKYEVRNTVMIKVVVIFVICVMVVLVTYMCFLLCLDPMLRRQRSGIRYEHHKDEDTDENIFTSPANNEMQPTASVTSSTSDGHIRTRNAGGGSVLDRVEAQQNKWMRKVEEQRKNIFTDHTMLN